jgi:putative FmdB family regulatory protein
MVWAVPVFEYRCATCTKKFQLLVGVVAGAEDERCPHCGSSTTSKLVSRFARYRSEDDRIDEVADRMESMAEPDSPAEMREIMREMGKAMDEDVSDEMEEMFEADLEGKLEDE